MGLGHHQRSFSVSRVGEEIYQRTIKKTKERMSASIKQRDWSLAESPLILEIDKNLSSVLSVGRN